MKKPSTPLDEQILRASKEIVVKFIEVGRVSPSSFGESFRDIYESIDKTVKEAVLTTSHDEEHQEALKK